MKKPTGKVIAAVVLAAIAAGAWYMTKARPLAVDVAAIERNVAVKVFGLGTVEARILSHIGFKVSNPIAQINVDAGDRVTRGDVLARLDSAEQEARLAMARAGLLAAEAAVKSARSTIRRADAILAKKQNTNARQQALYAKRTISTEAAEAARLEVDTARAEVDIARSGLLAAEAALSTARAQVELEDVALAQHTLKAPYDAVVITRNMELGTVVKAGEPLFTLVDPASVWVLGHISESRAGHIKLGQKAQIRLRSRPHELYDGKVQRIDIESDRVTEERRVYLSCGQCLDGFNLGEQAEVYVTTAVLEEALFVPENAVDDFDERQMKGTVWVLDDGHVRRRAVTFGHRTLDARLSITTPLPDDIKVLTRLPKLLKEGRSAEIKGDENP